MPHEFLSKKTKIAEKPEFDEQGYQTNLKDLNGEPLPNRSKLEFKPFKHGGARAGAGRKPSGRKAVLLRLSPKVIASLHKEAERSHSTLSDVAERRLAPG